MTGTFNRGFARKPGFFGKFVVSAKNYFLRYDRKHKRDASYDEKKNGRNHTALAAALSALAVAAASANTDAALAEVSVSDKRRCEDLYAIAKSKTDVDSACEYVNKQMEEDRWKANSTRRRSLSQEP